MSDYLVYELHAGRGKDTAPVYVGQGLKDRPQQHLKALEEFIAAVQNGGELRQYSPVYFGFMLHVLRGEEITIHIVKRGLTQNEAFEHERYLIEKHGKIIEGRGPLYNIEDGGLRHLSLRESFHRAKYLQGESNKTQGFFSKRNRPPYVARKYMRYCFGLFGSRA